MHPLFLFFSLSSLLPYTDFCHFFRNSVCAQNKNNGNNALRRAERRCRRIVAVLNTFSVCYGINNIGIILYVHVLEAVNLFKIGIYKTSDSENKNEHRRCAYARKRYIPNLFQSAAAVYFRRFIKRLIYSANRGKV